MSKKHRNWKPKPKSQARKEAKQRWDRNLAENFSPPVRKTRIDGQWVTAPDQPDWLDKKPEQPRPLVLDPDEPLTTKEKRRAGSKKYKKSRSNKRKIYRNGRWQHKTHTPQDR